MRRALLLIFISALVAIPIALPIGSSAVAHKRVRHCHGHVATIVGSRKNNYIVGTKHRDIIAARRGDDHVWGRRGRDLICGGKGNDTMDGMRGKRERIYGGRGFDLCLAFRHKEHRFHHKCELHLPGAPDKKPGMASGRNASVKLAVQQAKQADSASLAKQADSSASFYANAYVAEQPICKVTSYSSDNITGRISNIKVNVTGSYTNAGSVVGVVPVFFYRAGDSNNGWTQLNGDLENWSVPNDGRYYTLPLHDYPWSGEPAGGWDWHIWLVVGWDNGSGTYPLIQDVEINSYTQDFNLVGSFGSSVSGGMQCHT